MKSQVKYIQFVVFDQFLIFKQGKDQRPEKKGRLCNGACNDVIFTTSLSMIYP